jgi:hypothetical protein
LTVERNAFTVSRFLPLLSDEIGYKVMPQRTAALIFGVFVAAVAGLGFGLRRSRRPELVGWLGPAAAIVAAVVFVALGTASRQAAPPTVAVAQLIDVVPGGREQPVRGLLALYRPEAGPVPIGTDKGGRLDMDASGLEGQTRRRVMTDADAWHWENLALPAGIRTGTFTFTASLAEPPVAVASFGPNGLEGKLTAPAFRGLSDSLIHTLTRRPVAIQLRPDNSFTANNDGLLPPGQYLVNTILSDQQQQRQALYRHLLTETETRHLEDRNTLLAWAEPLEVPFTLVPNARTTGAALVTIPLEMQRTSPGTRVIIPRGFIACDRILEGNLARITPQSSVAVDMDLRFQLPPTVLPLQIERARLHLRVQAPGRRFTVSAPADGRPVELHRVENPAGSFQVDIDQVRFLRLDDRGGLHLSISIGNVSSGPGGTGDPGWSIETLELGVIGRTIEGTGT